MNTVKILLAGGAPFFNESVTHLSSYDNVKIVGTAVSETELLESSILNHPDIIIIDLSTHGIVEGDLFSRLKVKHPFCKVIVVSFPIDITSVNELKNTGVCGFISKNSYPMLFGNALNQINDIGYFFDLLVLSSEFKKESTDKSRAINQHLFTKAEADILSLICQDKATKEIAAELHFSERTVERYKSKLYEKTKAKTSGGLILFALRHNFFFMY